MSEERPMAEPTVSESIEQKLQSVYHLDREHCVRELMTIQQPKLDFTTDYLEALSVDRLRHLLAAAYLQSKKRRRPGER